MASAGEIGKSRNAAPVVPARAACYLAAMTPDASPADHHGPAVPPGPSPAVGPLPAADAAATPTSGALPPPGPAIGDDIPSPRPTAAQLAWAQARAARLDRWRRPLVTRWDRLRAWTNMLLVDHGIFRVVYLNLHAVGARAFRASQPAPHQLRAFARAGGRHVVTLRGGQTFGSLPLEIEACARAGLSFHTLVLRSRALPSAAEVHAAARLFASLDGPVLFHCKSGADRAGFAAALWLMLVEGRPVAEAQDQLHWRYGHIRQGKTGVLDTFFAAYARDTAQAPMPLLTWVDRHYDPAALTAAFRPTSWGSLLSDRLLARE